MPQKTDLLKITIGILELTFLIVGATTPILKITEFWVFSNEIIIIELISTLYSSGEYLLFIAVTIFGFLLPAVKSLFHILNVNFLARYNLERFSMLDIFLVSFLIFSSKITSVLKAEISYGFYFLLTSALLSYLNTHKFKK